MSYNNQMNAPSWFDCFSCKKISPIPCERTYAEFYWQTAVDNGFVPADLMYMKDTIVKEVLPSIWPNGPYDLFVYWTATFNPIAPMFNRYSGGFSIQEPQADELRYMVNMIYQWFAARQVEAPGNLGAVSGACDNGACSYPFNRYDGEANATMSPVPCSVGDSKMRIYCPQGYVYDPQTNMCVPVPNSGVGVSGCGCNSNGDVGAPFGVIPKTNINKATKVVSDSWYEKPRDGFWLLANHYDKDNNRFVAYAYIQGMNNNYVNILEWWANVISGNDQGSEYERIKKNLVTRWHGPRHAIKSITGSDFAEPMTILRRSDYSKSISDIARLNETIYL
jgi:hypothetical protein